ncbi:MAG: hypothetical protein P8Y67_01555 [Alphaproteobacteria bacterium]
MAANTKSVSSASSKTSNSGNASVAKEATLPDFEKNIAEWNAALERIESTFSEESVSKSALDEPSPNNALNSTIRLAL